jgi:hypothetical protein
MAMVESKVVSHGNQGSCRVRREVRACKHPGCGRKFEGSPTSLYCVDHRTRKSRAERFIPKEMPKPEDQNLLLDANEHLTQKTLVCSLNGCGKAYSFTVYPDHTIYPMFCELHRTEHKRRHFMRMRETGKQTVEEAPQYMKWSDYEMQFETYALQQPHVSPFAPRRNRTASH